MTQLIASPLLFGIRCFLPSMLIAGTCIAAESRVYYDESWLKINQYSPVEGFESHGSFGWHLGVGIIKASSPVNSDRSHDDGSGFVEKAGAVPVQIPRFFLTKGTSWPVDFGFSLARLNTDKARQFGAHIQWTIFEDFQKPAVALRISKMKIEDLPGLETLESDSAILGISYGFLRYFNFGLGIGRQKHQLVTKPMDETNAFGLRAGWGERLQRTESIWTVCLKMNLFSPFTSLAVERVYTHPKESLTLAKLSYML